LLRSKWAAGKARAGSIPHQFYSRLGKPDRRNVKLVRDVTDEQRSRRPIFIATFRAGASWLFFGVALSTRISKIWVFVRALKKQRFNLRRALKITQRMRVVSRNAGALLLEADERHKQADKNRFPRNY
jgi:hypothetical protein